MKRLVWFRNDLRLHDNETLRAALKSRDARAAFLFIYDERWDHFTKEGFSRTGKFRKRFLAESLLDLKNSLHALGGELQVVKGKPEEIIPQVCESEEIDELFLSSHFAYDERRIELEIMKALDAKNKKTYRFANHTMLHPSDLPFSISDLPMIFTEFRKRVEAKTRPRDLFPTPIEIPGTPTLVSTLKNEFESEWQSWLHFKSDSPLKSTHYHSIRGGERVGLQRLKEYLWDTDEIQFYKEKRNGLSETNDSSKLSPWLSLGCLSAKKIASEVARYEKERLKNDSTYWLIFELLWRDYFQFLALKYGKKIFLKSGLKSTPQQHGKLKTEIENAHESAHGLERFTAWIDGMTGYPLVDAAMRELKATGWMSNRARQNVASFLVHNLKVDWRKGARWFEHHLLDYDPCSNWANWCYVAGVGTDPRDRVFNVVKQSKDYDPEAKFIHQWIPELNSLTGSRALEPWNEPLLAINYPQRILP